MTLMYTPSSRFITVHLFFRIQMDSVIHLALLYTDVYMLISFFHQVSLKRGDKLTLQYEHSFTLYCEKVSLFERFPKTLVNNKLTQHQPSISWFYSASNFMNEIIKMILFSVEKFKSQILVHMHIGQYLTRFIAFPYCEPLDNTSYHLLKIKIGQYYYTRNVPVFTYTGKFQYLEP